VGAYGLQGDSPYGCADMAGNVIEWLNDWYDADYYRHSPARDPKGPPSGNVKVQRGSFGARSDRYRAAFCISTHPNYPAMAGMVFGFRCAVSPGE
jgi:formylglycine-generating enzyme required for sulfatase activity